MMINTHLFHNVVDVMFTLITMLGGMVKSSTQTAWRAILFRLLVMCVILICSSIVLEIGPTTVASSKMLRSSALASASKYSFGSPENMAYVCYHIVCDFVAVHFSDSDNSETDADYIEVFGLCFMV